VLTDRAEALDDDPRPRQRQPDMLPRDIDRDRKAKAGGADLVEDARRMRARGVMIRAVATTTPETTVEESLGS
jgi:hypothetical protein